MHIELYSLFGVSFLLTGLTTGICASFLLDVLLKERVDVTQLTQYSRNRILKLRSSSTLYWAFEPVLEKLASVPVIRKLVRYKDLDRYVAAGGCKLPFRTNELVGILVLRVGITSLLAICFSLWMIGGLITSLFLAGLTGLFVFWSSYRKIARGASNRIREINRRLPFVVDLLSMQIQAGSSFRQAFAIVTKELGDHPMGVEFRRVVSQAERGVALNQALENMQLRLGGGPVKELVYSIQYSTRRGTPIALTLTNFAEQMRIKRTQFAEKLAGKAQVNIAFPVFMIMGACLLIILAPFVIQVFENSPF